MSVLRGRWILEIPVVATALVACQFDTTGLAPPVEPDAALPQDASVDASALDGGGGCTDGDQRCYGPDIELCTSGQWGQLTACDWGCTSSVPPYLNCGSPLWAETVNMSTDVGTGIWVATASEITTIDTDTGTVRTPSGEIADDYVVRFHPRSPELGPVTIIGFNEIRIPVGARVEVVGSASLALVAYTTITIGGELIAQGHSDGSAGPGGFRGGLDGERGAGDGGGGAGSASTTGLLRSGAGGGGNAEGGGAGGTVSQGLGTEAGGPGGAAVSIDPINGPLTGGSGGGASMGLVTVTPAPGGGGGGALLLAAQDVVEILPTGVVNAGGGGGASRGAGGGGGAGGMVLIQTKLCVVQGVVAANGGGGGDGDYGGDGDPGSSSDLPTPGGGTFGGQGGAGSSLAGVAGTSNDYVGGGGGGAAGFVRFDTVLPPDIGQGTVSPHEGTPGHAQNSFPIQ